MSNLPKLRVSGLGWDASEKLIDLEQARYFPFSQDLVITVDDQVVNSYDEIVHLAAVSPGCDKPYLEVVFLPVIVGG